MNTAEAWVNYIQHVATLKDKEYMRYAIERVQQDALTTPAGFLTFSAPMPAGLVTVTGPFPVASEDYDCLIECLNLMRRALVKEPTPAIRADGPAATATPA